MSEALPKDRPHVTIYRMFMISLIGLVVGTVSSFATIGFVELVSGLNRILYISSESRAGLPSGTLAYITIAVLTLGGLVVGLILHYGVKARRPLGPPDSILAVQLREKLPDPVSGFFSTLASILSLGFGASVGQYGPLVYLGSLVGQLASLLQLGVRDIRSIAIACGVAAAISTAFNAPIAGLIFTHEVILRHYSLRIFSAVTVATASGFVVANVVFNRPVMFLIEYERVFHASEFFLFALEGLASGVLAIVFMKLLWAANRLSNRLLLPAPSKPMLAGFLLGLVSLQVPEVLGAGQEIMRVASIPGAYSALELSSILIAKILVTALCIGFGFAGGVIFPSMLIGTLFGALFAVTVPEILLDYYSGLSVYAISGMVAIVSPVIGAPLTGLLIVFELTRNYDVTIAAMVTIVFANIVAYHWYGRSLFDAQLAERGLDLSLGRDRAYLKHHPAVDVADLDFPCADSQSTCGELVEQLKSDARHSAIVIDSQGKFLGLVHLDQLLEQPTDTSLAALEYPDGLIFDETTSLWSAMNSMRDYLGEAVPVVHSVTGRYLGMVPEGEVIGVYLDAVHDLRREEHQA